MKRTALFIYLATALGAAAHSGHDHALPPESTAHWLFSPMHGLGGLAVALCLVIVLRHLRQTRE